MICFVLKPRYLFNKRMSLIKTIRSVFRQQTWPQLKYVSGHFSLSYIYGGLAPTMNNNSIASLPRWLAGDSETSLSHFFLVCRLEGTFLNESSRVIQQAKLYALLLNGALENWKQTGEFCHLCCNCTCELFFHCLNKRDKEKKADLATYLNKCVSFSCRLKYESQQYKCMLAGRFLYCLNCKRNTWVLRKMYRVYWRCVISVYADRMELGTSWTQNFAIIWSLDTPIKV